jgi:hypothetical protein
VRRETGKEQEVKVLYSEGVATHTAPEPCVVSREGQGEASAGERAGWPLSRERPFSRAPTGLLTRKATRTAAFIASGGPARRGLRPQHARTLLAREPGGLLTVSRKSAPRDRAGKA